MKELIEQLDEISSAIRNIEPNEKVTVEFSDETYNALFYSFEQLTKSTNRIADALEKMLDNGK